MKYLKRILWMSSFVVLVMIASIAMGHPYKWIPLPASWETMSARIIRTCLHLGRRWIDPSFRARGYCGYPLFCSKQPLDVVIPIVEKDLEVAYESIKSVHAWVRHPINAIYLVAPESQAIRRFAQELGCTFVLENSVVDNFDAVRKQYGGWIVQQFIKLNANRICQNENILILDADTVFLRPHVFIDDQTGVYTFNAHDQYFLRRKELTDALLQNNDRYKIDFVAHHMIFNKLWLADLQQHIEKLYDKPWQEAVLDFVEKDSYGFSEYDIYATYAFSKHRKQVRILSSANVLVYRELFRFFDLYRGVYAQDYKSVSSHDFMRLFEK